MRRRLTLTLGRVHEGQRLDIVLQAWLPEALAHPLSRAAVRRLVMAGAVRVRGQPVRRPGLPVRAGTRLEVDVDLERLVPATAPDASALRILYEDEVLLAVDKPPGLPTHATADPSRAHLVGLVQARLRAAGAEPYLAVHHRLDRDVSGVVVFAKHVSANPGLSRAFAGREVEKTYHALTLPPRRDVPEAWTVRDRLAPAGKRRVESVARGGSEAETRFRLLERHARGLLVEAAPLTGRKHQIRVHLAESGLPILGDLTYGAPERSAPRLLLHATRLALSHPVTGAPLLITSPYPADFRDALLSLRSARS